MTPELIARCIAVGNYASSIAVQSAVISAREATRKLVSALRDDDRKLAEWYARIRKSYILRARLAQARDGYVSLGHIRSLQCCCCDQLTSGRQWQKKEQGYGLCSTCIPNARTGVDKDEFASSHGLRGIHFDL